MMPGQPYILLLLKVSLVKDSKQIAIKIAYDRGRCHILQGLDMSSSDYDARTTLHLEFHQFPRSS